VEDIGAGMSVSWFDFDNDGTEDLYVADMWTAAGIRISSRRFFRRMPDQKSRALYESTRRATVCTETSGAVFEDASDGPERPWALVVVERRLGFHHDGFFRICTFANGCFGNDTRRPQQLFLATVVANSPNEPSQAMSRARWNALNELIRSDHTWSGFERNVFYMNNRDGTFSDVSGIAGLDFWKTAGRCPGDFDRDGRLESCLERIATGPQYRYLKNVLPELPPVISFRLSGRRAIARIGARITVETELGRQSRILRIGSGFLAHKTRK